MAVIASTPVAYVDERIRLGQISTEFSDTIKQRRRDAHMAFELDCDVLGFTEAGAIWDDLKRIGATYGYKVYPGPGGGGFALADRCTVLTDGFVRTIESSPGYHGVRGPHWIQFLTAAGNLAHVVEAHFLTGTILGPKTTHREGKNVDLAHALGTHTAMLAKGPALGFWMVDANVDKRKDDGSDPEGPTAILAQYGLVEINDALGRRPRKTTKFKALDWIGNVKSDKRVRAEDVEVMPFGNSNHAPVVATYFIGAEKQPPTPEPTPCPVTTVVEFPCTLLAGHDGPHVPVLP